MKVKELIQKLANLDFEAPVLFGVNESFYPIDSVVENYEGTILLENNFKEDNNSEEPYKYQDIIDDILEDFNFDKVLKAMIAVDWQYYTNEGKKLVTPTIDMLKETATTVIKDALDHLVKTKQDGWYMTGGFQAHAFYVDKNDELMDKPSVVLRFILETMEVSYAD